MPLKTGYSWTFKVSTADTITMKTQTVGAEEMVGGAGPHSATMAFKMVTSKNNGMDETISWQGIVGTKVVRYREHSFSATTGQLELEEYWDPPKLRVDETPANTMPDARWLEIYSETKIPVNGVMTKTEQRDSWKVIGIESITVPAQTFSAALHLQKVSATSSNVKEYWFVPGVGKVKETGQSGVDQEELVSYMVTP